MEQALAYVCCPADESMADRLHIICTTLDGLIKIKEAE